MVVIYVDDVVVSDANGLNCSLPGWYLHCWNVFLIYLKCFGVSKPNIETFCDLVQGLVVFNCMFDINVY